MARKLRRILPAILPVLGVALIFSAVFVGGSVVLKLVLVVAGLVLTQAGVWRFGEPIVPDDRKYLALRAEADRFMGLVRMLNTTALALDRGDDEGSRFAMAELEREMRRCVDRMIWVAGKPLHTAVTPGLTAEPAGPVPAGGDGADPDPGARG